jgi:GrpB-like predicted nucleotidyltransferase (UPF0157 family)
MLLFRDWLRRNEADRKLYECTKLALAARDWDEMRQDADAKTTIVRKILERAESR